MDIIDLKHDSTVFVAINSTIGYLTNKKLNLNWKYKGYEGEVWETDFVMAVNTLFEWIKNQRSLFKVKSNSETSLYLLKPHYNIVKKKKVFNISGRKAIELILKENIYLLEMELINELKDDV